MKKIVVVGLLIMSAPLLGALQQYAGKTLTPKPYNSSYNFSSYNKFNTPNYNYPNYQNIAPTTDYRNYSLFRKKEEIPSPSEQTREFNKKFRKFLTEGGEQPSPTIIIPKKSWSQRFYEWRYGTPESKIDPNLFPLTKQSPMFAERAAALKRVQQNPSMMQQDNSWWNKLLVWLGIGTAVGIATYNNSAEAAEENTLSKAKKDEIIQNTIAYIKDYIGLTGSADTKQFMSEILNQLTQNPDSVDPTIINAAFISTYLFKTMLAKENLDPIVARCNAAETMTPPTNNATAKEKAFFASHKAYYNKDKCFSAQFKLSTLNSMLFTPNEQNDKKVTDILFFVKNQFSLDVGNRDIYTYIRETHRDLFSDQSNTAIIDALNNVIGNTEEGKQREQKFLIYLANINKQVLKKYENKSAKEQYKAFFFLSLLVNGIEASLAKSLDVEKVTWTIPWDAKLYELSQKLKK